MVEHNATHPDNPLIEEEGVQLQPAGYEKYGRNKKGKPKDSYEAGYSNVSILERMNIERVIADRAISLYVEGIGTQNNLADDKPGNMFGIFKTGIKNKVQIGIGRLAAAITKVLEKQDNAQVERLIINVFGFSRGSTAARHFVSLVNDKVPLATRLGIPKAKVKIKFVGVFDTVSSHGVGLGFGSDVEELGLALGTELDKIVHLVAANEHRQNFSLTDITSSLSKGYELVLPGVHSNIGGSYGELTDEEERHLNPKECATLIDQGWYRANEIKRTLHPVYDTDTGRFLYNYETAVGERFNLTWEYQFIPLGIMATCAGKLMQLEQLVPGSPFEKYTLPAGHELLPVQEVFVKQVNGHHEQGRHALQLPDDPNLDFKKKPVAILEPLKLQISQVQLVRNRYLHRSASRGIQGMADGRPGMGERRHKGQPYRLVFPG